MNLQLIEPKQVHEIISDLFKIQNLYCNIYFGESYNYYYNNIGPVIVQLSGESTGGNNDMLIANTRHRVAVVTAKRAAYDEIEFTCVLSFKYP